MTTTTTHLPSPSPSPTRTHFHAHAHEPNPHPYAIKTTSTGLLTRSNSSPHGQGGRSRYVPLVSARGRTGSVSSASDSGSEGNGHKLSRSVHAEPPAPLPIPPPSPARSRSDSGTHLPANPYQWNPAQLSTYLSTVLSAHGPAFARELTAWVREAGWGGRTFLSLDLGQLERTSLPPAWRAALLSASLALQQQNFFAFSPSPPPSDDTSEDEPSSPSSSPCYMRLFEDSFAPPHSSSPEANPFASNLALPADKGMAHHPHPRRYTHTTIGRSVGRRGKVRGLVDCWERSDPVPAPHRGVRAPLSGPPSDAIGLGEMGGQEVSHPLQTPNGHTHSNDSGQRTLNLAEPKPEEQEAEEIERQEGEEGEAIREGRHIVGWDSPYAYPSTMTRFHLPAAVPICAQEQANGNVNKNGGRGNEGRRTIAAIFSAEPEPMLEGTVVDVDSHTQTHPQTQMHMDPPSTSRVVRQGVMDVEEGEGSAEVLIGVELDLHVEVERVVANSEVGEDRGEGGELALEKETEGARKTESELVLEAELARTRLLVRTFERRLKEVESRVEVMDVNLQRQMQREGEGQARSIPISRASLPAVGGTSAASAIFKRALSYFSTTWPSTTSTAPAASTAVPDPDRKNASDPPVSALPSYVLLVSIGMCAVVLRVVLGRVVRGARTQ